MIVGVLLVPSAVVGKVAEACCGVEPIDLGVSDAPDPVCVGETVTISIDYTVIRSWIPPPAILPYDTGYLLTIIAPDSTVIVDDSITLATAQPDPLPAGVGWSDSYDFTPTAAGTYIYQVAAWSWTTAGTMTTDIVAGEITVEECCVADSALEQEIRAAIAAACPEGDEYKNHGEYVSCAAQIIDGYLEAGDITEEEASCFMNPIARSRVGIPDNSGKPGKGPK